ncbi:MAG: carboxypeptidase regulatory-like domain-containing protein [Saprospiraceae bacterium]|nr:carboxypeptidase regulatory-like domain-containing protein [Saprospiraceae bacterium]
MKPISLLFFLIPLWVACNTSQGLPRNGPATGSRLLSFEKTPAASDSTCTLLVLVRDLNRNEPMGNVVVLFTKTSERTMLGSVTKMDGQIERRLRPGTYDLELRFTGKQSYFQEKLLLRPGWQYRLNIGLEDQVREKS